MTVREMLEAIAKEAGCSFIQHHPDDDPMIGTYREHNGSDWILVKAEAYVDRATGGGPMACQWLLDFVQRLARAVAKVCPEAMEVTDD